MIEEDGKEIKIVRANMPFGQAGQGEFGTYFIGYARSPRTIEQMLTNMFVGRPPGNYDRLLDFSRAVTGNLFFVPSATFLDDVTSDQPATGTPSPRSAGNPRPRPHSRPRRRGRLARHRLPERRRPGMNNLHRELAPISDAAWAQIEEEASRTLKRYLAARRVVDVHGPTAAPCSRPSAPATCGMIAAPGDGIIARQREVKPLVELRVPFELDRRAIDDVERGVERFRLAAAERCRASASPLPRTVQSSTATPPPTFRASDRAPATRSSRCRPTVARLSRAPSPRR